MKILWLSHLVPYPPKGGALQRSYNLIRELSVYHELDLLAFNQRALISPLFDSVTSGIDEARITLNRFCRRLAFFDIDSDRSVWRRYLLGLKSLFCKPFTINWLKSESFASKMKDWIEQKDYDLVHFDTISLVPFFHLVPSFIATSLDHHNIESHMLLRRAQNETNLMKRIYFWQEGIRLRRYEQCFCPRFSLNITCSDTDSGRLSEIVPNANIQTIPNGVDLDFFKPQGIFDKTKRLIFVGTMGWYPNINAVLYLAERLWLKLKEKHPDLECDIIGANPPIIIRELSNRFPDFHVYGFVDDVRSYIDAATVYVCPIQDGGGTKLKILDAMAMAKAVVAHPVACEGINIIDNHNILLACDESEFVEHIDLLLNSTEKREAIGREARRLVEEFYGYKAIGRQLSEALQSCIK
jgi:polysaccharide biosynthesis protein PslH